MKFLHVAAAAGVLCLPLAALSTPVLAASAHNSQLGAGGPVSNDAGPSGIHKRQKQFKRRAKGM